MKTERIFVRKRERAKPRRSFDQARRRVGVCVCGGGMRPGTIVHGSPARCRTSHRQPAKRAGTRAPTPPDDHYRTDRWRGGERRAGSRPAGLLAAATGRAQRPCRVLFLTRRAGGPAACAGYGDRAARSDGTAESVVASPFSVTKHGTGVLPPSRRCANRLFSSSAHVLAAAIPDAASAIALFRT